LTVQSWLDAETLWDYGYFEVNDGTGWVSLADTTGLCTTENPNGTLLPGACGFTGFIGEGLASGTHTTTFDLSAYAGSAIDVRFRYVTDAAVQGQGWFLDDLSLDDANGTLSFDDGDDGVWSFEGWMGVPFTAVYPQYYLAEWRNASGFDTGLAYPYRTLFFDQDEWMVERTPYTVPGMLLWYRNFKYSDNFFIGASLFDDPSWGSKGMLLVVDSHPQPLRFSEGAPRPPAGNLGGRNQPSNATFGLVRTTSFKLTRALGFPQQKVFGNQSPVSVFDDSLGYYPGIETFGGFGYFADFDASVVVPATASYPPYWAGVFLPSSFAGNPGPYAYGVTMEVQSQAADGSWGEIFVSP
ncbi:MAG: immune inhibitor A, partial [Chloroflexi bacterium]|nr:immune inhibitor A [Chloroflexota bacterium]